MNARIGVSPTLVASKHLSAAARLIGQARTQRLLATDATTAIRLSRLAGMVAGEAEMLEGVARHRLPVPEPMYPPGATIGWLVRNDASTRAMRRAAGLRVPEVDCA